MGKLLLTNNQNWNDNLKNHFLENGFSEKGRFDESFHMTTYRKLNVDHDNFYVQGDEYVASAGTLIYGDFVGADALKMILEDFDGDVAKIRKKIAGCYVLAIKSNNKITVFVDEQNVYAAYYHYDGKNFLLTTTYYHIQHCLRKHCDRNSLMEQIFTFAICGNQTIFSDIFQLMGDEYLSIDLNSEEVKLGTVVETLYASGLNSFEDQVELIAEKAVSYARKKLLFREELWQFTTGGVDTRVALAINLRAGIKPCIASWHGDSVDIQSYDEDTVHAAMLAEIEHLPIRIFDVSRNLMEELDHSFVDKLEKYGEHALTYGGHPAWFKIFEEGNVTFAEFGSFGETLKIFDGFEYHEPMTIRDYAKIYLDRLEIKLDKNSTFTVDNLLDHMTQRFMVIAKARNMNPQNLTFDDCLYFYRRYHSRSGEASIFNFVNMFAFGWDVLSEKEIGDYIYEIDYHKKEHKHLHLCLINKIWPELLNVTFFTHCHKVLANPQELVLSAPSDESFGSKVRHTVKPIFEKFILGRVLINYYRNKFGSYGKDYAIAKKFVERINQLGVFALHGVIIDENSFVQMPIYQAIFRYSVMISILNNDEKVRELLLP